MLDGNYRDFAEVLRIGHALEGACRGQAADPSGNAPGEADALRPRGAV